MKVKNCVLMFSANIGLFGFSILFIELALQLASVFFVDADLITRPPLPLMVDDDRLGNRGNPEWLEHDARGFRNTSALSSSILVALGDSHTYGTSVSSEESWPSVVSAHLGKDVYNMGFGGYGPAANQENLDIALELKSKLIIFGLYFGNDFYDDFKFAQRNGKLSEYAREDVLIEISELDSQRSIVEEVGFLFRKGREAKPQKTDIRKWLSNHSRLYGLLRTLKKQIAFVVEDNALLARNFEDAKESITDQQSPFVSVYNGPRWKTIFTSPYRDRVMDDADPRIRIGIEISKQILEKMHLRVSGSGANFLVLLLPTKEYVFWPQVENSDEHNMLAELVQHEYRIRGEIKIFMQERDIDFIDPLAELRKSGRQPYFPNGDGHPNALGQNIIAVSVLEFIKRNKILRVVSP